MGLDMYLNAKRYVSRSLWDNANQTREENPKWKEIAEASGLAGYSGDDWTGIYVNATAIYWRKANAIHNWFVNKVQNGVDDCGSYEVSMEQLLELQSDCEVVLAFPEKAMTVLPPSSGFFFGGTELDEWYFNGLKHAVAKIKRIANDPVFKDCDFTYQSSW